MNATFGNLANSRHRPQAVVVGAGVAGLVTAIELSIRGYAVDVFEAASGPGGKMRELVVGGQPIDSGPTVLTMHWVFEDLFERANAKLSDCVTLTRADILARHAWSDGSTLDLFSDLEQSVDAIGAFAGAREARAYREFTEHTRRIYEAVREPFLLGQRPSLWGMMRDPAVRSISPLAMDAHRSMAKSLASFFADPRLVQLFGRYATYVGSSPYETPGTLSLISHVERCGVHYVEGGMARLAGALVQLAEARGVRIAYEHRVTSLECVRDAVEAVHVETGSGSSSRHAADVVVYAGEVRALATGLLGEAARKAVDYDYPPGKRSLSALTLSALARPSGFPLVRHNVFFADDGKAEFDDLFLHRRLPRQPSVYVCAQERTDHAAPPAGFERLFFIVNAPASADVHPLHEQDRLACERAMTTLLERSGLTLEWGERTWTTPTDFEARFPGSEGALYGRTSHGMLAALSRPSARSKLRGLYLAGGSVHPGAGVPMAALSGRSAARAIEADSASNGPLQRAATAGSTSTA